MTLPQLLEEASLALHLTGAVALQNPPTQGLLHLALVQLSRTLAAAASGHCQKAFLALL